MLTKKNQDPSKIDWANIPILECLHGNAMDTHYTLRVFEILYEKLEEAGLINLYTHLTSPATGIFAMMEKNGLDVDVEELDSLGSRFDEAYVKADETLRSIPGVKEEDNFASIPNLREILYTREGGLELFPPDSTKKGDPSTSKDTLEIILNQIDKELLSE